MSSWFFVAWEINFLPQSNLVRESCNALHRGFNETANYEAIMNVKIRLNLWWLLLFLANNFKMKRNRLCNIIIALLCCGFWQFFRKKIYEFFDRIVHCDIRFCFKSKKGRFFRVLRELLAHVAICAEHSSNKKMKRTIKEQLLASAGSIQHFFVDSIKDVNVLIQSSSFVDTMLPGYVLLHLQQCRMWTWKRVYAVTALFFHTCLTIPLHYTSHSQILLLSY